MASSDPLIAKAIDVIEKSSLNPVNLKDSRPNLFTGGRLVYCLCNCQHTVKLAITKLEFFF